MILSLPQIKERDLFLDLLSKVQVIIELVIMYVRTYTYMQIYVWEL